MLQSMHDKIQGLVAWVIAIVIALTFALWGVQNYLHGGATNIVAKVNGKKITQEQFRAAYEQAKQSAMLRFGPNFSFDQKEQAKLKKDVLQYLIRKEVIFQAETKMGLGVSKQLLWSQVIGMPIFQVNGHFSPSNFRQIIQRMFYSEQAFFDEMAGLILSVQLERGIIDSNFILPTDIEFIKKIFKQRRDFGYFNVSLEGFANKVQVSEEEVRSYYKKNQDEFLLPEKISIQYLELSSDDLRYKVKPTEEQLKQYYQAHIDSFSTPKKWQITRVLLPISVQADAKVSQDAKKKMEDLVIQLKSKKDLSGLDSKIQVTTSWVVRSSVSPELAAHLDKLDTDQISPVFRTKEGYNLIKILAKQPPTIMPYNSVFAKVKATYERQQLTQAFSETTDRLYDLVYTNPDSLEPAAKELELKLKETGLITRADSNKEGILANNKIVNAAFSDMVLKQRYNSNLIEIGPSRVVVLRIKDYVPEKLQSLEQVQGVIREKIKLQKMREMGTNFAKVLLQDLDSGKAANDIAKQHNLLWHTVLGARYNQSGENAKLLETAFTLEKPKEKKVSATILEFNGGYAVLRLDKVYDDPLYKEDVRVDNSIKFLPGKFGQYDYETVVNNLMNRAKIEIIEKVEENSL